MKTTTVLPCGRICKAAYWRAIYAAQRSQAIDQPVRRKLIEAG